MSERGTEVEALAFARFRELFEPLIEIAVHGARERYPSFDEVDFILGGLAAFALNARLRDVDRVRIYHTIAAVLGADEDVIADAVERAEAIQRNERRLDS